MATCTLAARVVIDLRLMVAESRVIDASRGPGAGTTELTSRTDAVGRAAAGMIDWSVGSYDDSDGTVGDQRVLQWCVRWAWHQFITAFDMNEGGDSQVREDALMREWDMMRGGYAQEAATPVVYEED